MNRVIFICLFLLYSDVFSQVNPLHGYWEQIETGYSNTYMKYYKYAAPLNDAFIIDEYTIEAAGNLFDNLLFITPEEMKVIDDSTKSISENNIAYYDITEDGYLRIKLPVFGYERKLKIITLTNDTLVLQRDGWYHEKFVKRTFTDTSGKELSKIVFYRSGSDPFKNRKEPAPSQFTLEITNDRNYKIAEENKCYTGKIDTVSYNNIMKLLSYVDWANMSPEYGWNEPNAQYSFSVYYSDGSFKNVKADEFTYLAPIQLKTFSRRFVMLYNTLFYKRSSCN